MICSMTGFGRCEIVNESRKITVEMKAVNHRYFDVNIKIPRKLTFFENDIRNFLKSYIHRGKVDVYIGYEDYTENKLALSYNEGIASEYVKYIRQIAQDLDLRCDLTAEKLSKYPEVFVMEEQKLNEEQIWEAMEQALTGATEQFVESRRREGEHLKADLLEKLDGMLVSIGEIEKRAPEILSAYQNKLKAKVEEVLGDVKIDEARIVTEVTLFADKICTDEEVVRLKSHMINMRNTLEQGKEVGRKLDFIAQEMNREANTILSKSNDLQTSNIAIELKTDIEKIREQIQNIE